MEVGRNKAGVASGSKKIIFFSNNRFKAAKFRSLALIGGTTG
jgi:hypothetical protein